MEFGHDLELGGGEAFDELGGVEGFGGGLIGHVGGLDEGEGSPSGLCDGLYEDRGACETFFIRSGVFHTGL